MLIQAGVNLLSKAVTVLLLVLFGAMPVLGAVCCETDTRPSVCCSPGCSMMTMEKTGVQTELGPVDSSSSCCKVVPGLPVSMFTPTAPRLLPKVMLVGATIAAHVPNMILPVAGTPTNRYVHCRSRSILCNFRI